MPSKSETALAALKTALDGIGGGVTVSRNVDAPEEMKKDDKLLILRDGDPGEPEVILSPVTYSYEHVAELEALVQALDATRDTAWDTLLGQVSTAINVDKTLGGAVDITVLGRPVDPDVEPQEGVIGIKSGTIPITMYYDTTDPLN